MLLIHSGANSTMKTETKSAEKRAISTAPPVISSVDQISGQAWKV